MPARAQFQREPHQMIIMHPDYVVGLQDLGDLIGEIAVDAHVAGKVRARIFREVDPVVQQRPQHAVGEAVVIFLMVVDVEIESDIADVAPLDDLRRSGRLLGDAAAPAAPHALTPAQRRLDRDREAAGAFFARQSYAVGNDYQARHQAFSHVSDRRIAVLMTPAME